MPRRNKMDQVNVFQAKTDLSKLIRKLEKKEEQEIVIARNGTPIAVLTLYKPKQTSRRIGKFNGKFEIPDDIDESNDEVLELMGEMA